MAWYDERMFRDIKLKHCQNNPSSLWLQALLNFPFNEMYFNSHSDFKLFCLIVDQFLFLIQLLALSKLGEIIEISQMLRTGEPQ